VKLSTLFEAGYAKPPEMPMGDKSKALAVIPIYVEEYDIKRIVRYINEHTLNDDDLRPLSIQEVLSNHRMFKYVVWDFYQSALEVGGEMEEYWNADGWAADDIYEVRGEDLPY